MRSRPENPGKCPYSCRERNATRLPLRSRPENPGKCPFLRRERNATRLSLRSRPEIPGKCPYSCRKRNATRLSLHLRQDHLAPAPVPDSLSRIIRTIIRQGRLTTAGRTFKSETIDSWRSTENRFPENKGAISYKTLPYSYLRFECCTEQPLRTCHAHTCHAHARYMRQMLCMAAAQRRQMSLGVPC